MDSQASHSINCHSTCGDCYCSLGEEVTGKMLILSQVILSLQLGFAIIPLIHFTSDRQRMGKLAIPTWLKILAPDMH